MNTSVGIIGLGIITGAIAEHLARDGGVVYGYNIAFDRDSESQVLPLINATKKMTAPTK